MIYLSSEFPEADAEVMCTYQEVLVAASVWVFCKCFKVESLIQIASDNITAVQVLTLMP
jgi:hypothetical protein